MQAAQDEVHIQLTHRRYMHPLSPTRYQMCEPRISEEITTALDRNLQMGDRIARVETLVEQLLKKAPRDDVFDGLYLTRKDEGSNNSASNSSAVASDQVEAVTLLKPLEVSVQFDSPLNHANC
jgi:ribosomal protein L19